VILKAAEQTRTQFRHWHRRAVIDIGSNSVRMVVYGGPDRTPISIFNEKTLCGLGRRDPDTGALRDDAMEEALLTLARFKAVLSRYGDPDLTVFATAASREASNGPDFIARIEALGFQPEVISGEEEARFAALGVLSGDPGAVVCEPDRPHLCGDMGGGSLELTRFTDTFDEPLGDRVSLPLGPLRLMAECGPKVIDAVSFTEDRLSENAWLTEVKAGDLHAVGGAWRAIAKVHMARRNYPLQVLHHYTMSKDDTIEICELLEHQSAAALENIPGVQKKRIDVLPHAAMVMKVVMNMTKAQRLIVSSSGVREGVLFDKLPMDVRRRDPLIELAEEYALRYCPDPAFGETVFVMTNDLWPDESEQERRLRQAACLLSDVAALHHPDMRADQACDMALRSPFIGIDHPYRVALAMALYQRHKSKPSTPESHVPIQLVGEELQKRATGIGLMLRFAADFSPKSAEGIEGCTLAQVDDKLVFTAPELLAGLMGELASKRLDTLANFLGKQAVVEFV